MFGLSTFNLGSEVVFSYLFNFIFFFTAFNVFTWFRNYIPFYAGISICLILSCAPFILLPDGLISSKDFSKNIPIELFTVIVSALIAVLPIYLLLEALPFFARIIDILRGMQFAEVNFGQVRGSIFEGIYNLFVPIVFFKMDLAQYIVSVRLNAFKCASNCTSSLGHQNFDYLIQLSSDSLKFAFLSVLPIFAITVSLDLLILVLTRLLGRVNVSFELTPLKSILALFVLYLNSEIIMETICPQINNFLLAQKS